MNADESLKYQELAKRITNLEGDLEILRDATEAHLRVIAEPPPPLCQASMHEGASPASPNRSCISCKKLQGEYDALLKYNRLLLHGSIHNMQNAAYENSVNHGWYNGVQVGDASLIPEKLCLIHS